MKCILLQGSQDSATHVFIACSLMILLSVFTLPSICLSLAESDPLPSPYQGEEMTLFQEIPSVYGASKYEQKVTEAPSSVTIITASEITKYGYRTLADILQSVAGFFATYDRNYSYIGVRGFARPGDYNSHVLLLVDGHRINDDVYGQAPIGTDFPIDIDLINRVEIIRGPSSSIYGSNAFFGVINVVTNSGRQIKALELSGEAGSHNAYKGRSTFGDRFSNGLEMVISGSLYHSEGQDLHFKEFDRPPHFRGIARNCDEDLFRSFFSKLSYYGFSLESIYSFRDKGIPTASWGTAFNDSRAATLDERVHLDLKYEHMFENQLNLMSRVYYDRYNYDGSYPYDDPDPILYKDYSRTESAGAEIQLSRRLFQNHKLLVGAEYRNSLRQDQVAYNMDPFFLYMDDRRQSQNFAVYLQDEYHILDTLTLNAGLRYDWFETFGSTTNPRLALIYHPLEKTVLKLIYGTAFRAPNAYELYYDDGITQRGNLDLKPEEIKTFELIWEQYLNNHLRLSATGFYYGIRNLISLTNPGDDIFQFNNIDKVQSKGVELELDGRWPTGIETRVSYSLQDAKDGRTGETLTNSPQHLAKFNLVWPLIRNRLFAGTELRYMSLRKTIGGKEADAFFITNLTLYGRRLWRDLDVSASVYNLFDQKYGDPGSEEHLQDIIIQDGTSLRLKMTYSF